MFGSSIIQVYSETAEQGYVIIKSAYELRPRKDHRGVDLVSDALPFGRLWYGEPNATGNAIGYAKHYSRSHHAVIRVSDAAGNVIETSTRATSKSGKVFSSHRTPVPW
jgi:hypothetical protein